MIAGALLEAIRRQSRSIAARRGRKVKFSEWTDHHDNDAPDEGLSV